MALRFRLLAIIWEALNKLLDRFKMPKGAERLVPRNKLLKYFMSVVLRELLDRSK